jgi:hypothetical protein
MATLIAFFISLATLTSIGNYNVECDCQIEQQGIVNDDMDAHIVNDDMDAHIVNDDMDAH